MFSFPFFKKRRIEELQNRVFFIQEYLHGTAGRDQLLRFFIEQAITELDFSGHARDKTRFYYNAVPITKGFLERAIYIHYRNNETVFIKIKVSDTILVPKIF